MTDDAGQITDTFSYDAYGMMLGGNPTSAAPAATSLLYAGEQFDLDLQQYYLRARYYDPLNGRFNRVDPFAGDTQDPQSLHKYLYCHANPVNSLDPSGMMLGGSYSLSEVIMISAMMGILAGMVTYQVTGSFKASVIVGASAFLLSFIALGGVGLTIAAITGGGAATSPYLLDPNTWQEAESMLGKVLQLNKNRTPCFEPGMITYRVPDFINKGGRFIADSKWRQSLYMTDQLRDFEVLAKVWEVRLYIFVCQSTHVSQSVIKLCKRTGGDVIRIFKG